ncbi:hypothetical protein [Lonepinella sp. BR2271]|uniref:hypothetical protein n=1 Tax=Lonepinella sp. BR2271 TaxID=3434550 RepID=UPI003F6DC3AD
MGLIFSPSNAIKSDENGHYYSTGFRVQGQQKVVSRILKDEQALFSSHSYNKDEGLDCFHTQSYNDCGHDYMIHISTQAIHPIGIIHTSMYQMPIVGLMAALIFIAGFKWLRFKKDLRVIE